MSCSITQERFTSVSPSLCFYIPCFSFKPSGLNWFLLAGSQMLNLWAELSIFKSSIVISSPSPRHHSRTLVLSVSEVCLIPGVPSDEESSPSDVSTVFQREKKWRDEDGEEGKNLLDSFHLQPESKRALCFWWMMRECEQPPDLAIRTSVCVCVCVINSSCLGPAGHDILIKRPIKVFPWCHSVCGEAGGGSRRVGLVDSRRRWTGRRPFVSAAEWSRAEERNWSHVESKN